MLAFTRSVWEYMLTGGTSVNHFHLLFELDPIEFGIYALVV